jgi:hypothetical protein
MTRPDRDQIDVEQYYSEKSALVASGEAVWVENFEVDAKSEDRFTGFFKANRLVALIRECKVDKVPRRYPLIYLMKDGKPVPRRTTKDFEEAQAWVENI